MPRNRLPFARLAARVEKENGMVNNARIAGAKFHHVHVLILFGIQRNYETTELIGALGWNRVRLGHLDYLIRLTAQPSGSKLRRSRLRGWIALRRAMHRPVANHCDLRLGKSALVQKLAVAGSGFPRWHHARLRNGSDLLRPLRCVFVS